jgi:hypothetical protein
VARFEKNAVEGFARLPEGLTADGLDVLSPEGAITHVALSDLRAVCFVRDFGAGETWRKQRRFLSRPKTPGLWVRLHFIDGELLEAVTPNNLVGERSGYLVVPPDATFQNHHLFVPREALTSMEVLGVIGSPLRRPAKPVRDADKQMDMFGG